MQTETTTGNGTGRPLHPGVIIIAICMLIAFTGENVSRAEDKIQLVMTGSNRAIVMVDGERLVLRTGQTAVDGVRLLEADSDKAVLEIDGQPLTLESGSVAAPILQDDGDATGNIIESGGEKRDKTITLWADATGFFFARGKVNRRNTRFLIDTGANTVTFSSAQADRLGIKYKKGKDGYASTASGVAPIKVIKLDRISVEGITLRNVAANVVYGRFPEIPLLGGSFLNHLNMVRSGNKMELSRN